jgi:predicted nucleic acid-binding protein
MMIGTFCIKQNIKLLHSDRDFDAVNKHLKLQSIFLKKSG